MIKLNETFEIPLACESFFISTIKRIERKTENEESKKK